MMSSIATSIPVIRRIHDEHADRRAWNGATPPTIRTTTFPGTEKAARAARKWAVAQLGADSPHAYAVELIVSELATNAVVHSASGLRRWLRHGRMRVRLEVGPDGVRVEVTDQGARTAAPIPADPDEHCRGLVIVESLATEFGVDHTGRGRRVWAYLADEPATL